MFGVSLRVSGLEFGVWSVGLRVHLDTDEIAALVFRHLLRAIGVDLAT